MLNVYMLSVANKPFMLNVIMLNVIMLNVIMLNIIMLNVIMLSVIVLKVGGAHTNGPDKLDCCLERLAGDKHFSILSLSYEEMEVL
jgi:hypothetical protein